MTRREFLASAAAVPAGWSAATASIPSTGARPPGARRGAFAVDAHRVRFYSPNLERPFSVLMLADTHLFRDDERGAPYREYSRRMAAAYNQTRHFQTGDPTQPEEGFEQALAIARETEVALVALAGDIFSFPSEAAIEWAQERLKAAELPYLYVAGNHDWHYEGMPGSTAELRATWTENRLRPLYQGAHPLMASREIHGVRFLAIDNSTYEILPEQLDFFRTHVARGQPSVLLVHIPLYAPGRPVGYGCGHPDWNASTDRNFEIERRPRWPAGGHTPTTRAFHREVFQAPNLLAILAGHIHRPSLDVVNGLPQIVAGANATGAFLQVEFHPYHGLGVSP